MSINEVKDFINKITKIYEKNPSVLYFINIDELINSLNELDNIIEMYELKTVIVKHIQALIVFKVNPPQKKEKNKLHTVFYGTPGVGKSKTAKILSHIWKALGIIHCDNKEYKRKNCKNILNNINSFRENYLKMFENYITNQNKSSKTLWEENKDLWFNIKDNLSSVGNNLVENIENENIEDSDSEAQSIEDSYVVIAGRENFVAEYTGQTAIKTLKFLNSCKGKCIIIEEAYLLYNGEMDTFGMEALTVLNKFMDEHPKDIIIIFTGYEDKLKNGIFKAQPGLKRRCQLIFNMIGYTPEGLARIFISQLNDNEIYIEDEQFVKDFFVKNSESFENFGGDTEKLAFQCKMIYSETIINNMYNEVFDSNMKKIITNDILEIAFENYLKVIF